MVRATKIAKRQAGRGWSQARTRRSPNAKTLTRDVADDCLAPMIDNLLRTGYSPAKIVTKVRAWCEGQPEPSEPFDTKQLSYIVDAPHVIGRWHNDPDYLDANGNPVPLHGSEGATSLASLIARVLPAEDPPTIIDFLVERDWIRPTSGGYYLPAARHCIYSPRDTAWHTLSVTQCVMQTIVHNRHSPESEKLVERVATNPNVPVAVLPRLFTRLKAQATTLLQDADNDFQSFEQLPEAGPRARIGLGVYVFLAPPESVPEPTTRSTAAKSASKRKAAVTAQPRRKR